MGLFSNVLKRVKEGVPQAIENRRGPGFGIGSLMAKPDLEPKWLFKIQGVRKHMAAYENLVFEMSFFMS